MIKITVNVWVEEKTLSAVVPNHTNTDTWWRYFDGVADLQLLSTRKRWDISFELTSANTVDEDTVFTVGFGCVVMMNQ
jgi:hypothetical protein